ncbi:MAG TPA: M56 family metallopeptidase [Thermoanaerobaculia bacterium]|nr:M56 family metallopeptidase [Thermoanaerobaculia bacterium]
MIWTLLAERLVGVSVDLAILAVLVWGALRLLRPRSPRLVALLWLFVMIRPLIGLALDPAFLLDLPDVRVGREGQYVERREEVHIDQAGSAAVTASEISEAGTLASTAGWLWAAGLAALVLAAAIDRLRLRRLLSGAAPASAALGHRLAATARRLGVRGELPELLVTRSVESPALAGSWRPAILIPAWLAEEGSAEQIDWALGHELTHWRAKDHLSGIVRQLFQTVFFFHPVAWWVGRRWEEAVELACDRALVSSEEEAASYAERLYEMLARARGKRRMAVAGGLFATRTQIGRRIAALLRGPVSGPARLSPRSGAALGLLALLSLTVGAGCQTHKTGKINADLEHSGPEGRFHLDAEGTFALARNHEDVQSLEPGSHLTLEEKGEENVRIEITAGPDGEVRRVFTVNGEERPYDWQGRAWMARTLPRFAHELERWGHMRPVTRAWRRVENGAARLLR